MRRIERLPLPIAEHRVNKRVFLSGAGMLVFARPQSLKDIAFNLVKPVEQQGMELAPKLVASHQAEQYFSMAIASTQKGPITTFSNTLLRDIGKIQAQSGASYKSVLDILLSDKTDTSETGKKIDCIELYIAAGELEKATELIHSLGYKSAEDYLRRYKTTPTQDPDPEKKIAEIQEELKNLDVTFSDFPNDPTINKLVSKRRVDPTVVRRNREQIRNALLNRLIRACANCGKFQEAKKVLNSYTKEQQKTETGMFFYIAQEEYKREHYSEALTTSEKGLELLEIPEVENVLRDGRMLTKIKLLVLAGKAKVRLGRQNVVEFGQAEQILEEISKPNLRVEAYMEITKAIHDSGQDATEYFDKTRNAIGKMPHKPSYMDLDFIEQMMTYEDLLELESKSGYEKSVQQTIEAIKNHPRRDELYESISIALAYLGAFKMKKGLTQKEIEGLPRKDIQTLLESGDPQVLKALEYFGLDKKL